VQRDGTLYAYLDREFEHLWQQAKQPPPSPAAQAVQTP
jgi:hypothetical protein